MRLAIPTRPSRPEPKSHTEAGIGTGELPNMAVGMSMAGDRLYLHRKNHTAECLFKGRLLLFREILIINKFIGLSSAISRPLPITCKWPVEFAL